MSPLHRLATASRRLTIGLVITLAAVLGFGTAAFASPHDSGQRKPETPKPTIVLVHGGWDNSSGWDPVVTALHRRGFPVIAPADPLRDLAADSAYIRSVLETIKGPI